MKIKFLILTMLVSGVLAIASAQTRTITGKVSDVSGQPLAGVTIIVKGINTGTSTSQKGNYKISVTSADKVLQFSMIGYVTVHEKIGDRKMINITMKEDHTALNEMVVTGYGAKRSHELQANYMAAPASASYEAGHSISRFNRDFNTEGYAAMDENGFRNVKNNPLSTFSIDVDNASYSNIRRFINNGTLPPPEAVRIEEMINYFKYDYTEPGGVFPFSVYSELSGCPWNGKHHLLMVGLKGKSIDKSSLPPSNLVFLIDVSGSMDAPNKLPLLKSAFTLLVNELRPEDHIAIVVYSGAAGVVLQSTHGNKKDVIMHAINNLEAGGSTAGGAGLKLAYSIASENFIKGGNNRIILATDGDFNVGESSNGGMERLVEENRERGVFITVLGFGMGNIKDDKMEIIADKGNGNYSYIDNLQEAERVLVKEFGGTLFTIAKDVKFQIEFNPLKVQSYRLIGYENRLLNNEDFNDDRKDAGEMGSGHHVTALYELIPAGSDEKVPSVDPLKYQHTGNLGKTDNGYRHEYLTIKIRYKKPDGITSMLFEKPVNDYMNDLEDASDNLRFAAAVSEFGMILRNSEFRGNSTLDKAIELAKSARGRDEEGYRAEFIRLMGSVKGLKGLADKDF
jgi:Ca-activated chloride channel family protein